MSSHHVTLIGGDSGEQRQIVTVDRFNNALVIEGENHANIHRGIFYTASIAAPIVGDGSAFLLLRVLSGNAAHVRFTTTVDHTMLTQMYEAPTTTADGTPLAANNRNRFSSNTSTMLIFSEPTVTANGTKMLDFLVTGGDKQTASGGQGSSFEEWVLAPGDYLVIIENTVISPAAIGWAGFILDFYIPDQSPDQP